MAQHRIREKTFLAALGIPVTPFAPVRREADLVSALKAVGTPAVLKTAAFGYDGKGQAPLARPDEAVAAWEALGRREAILEAFLDLDKEISVIGARGVGGGGSHFGAIEQPRHRHSLDASAAPTHRPTATA